MILPEQLEALGIGVDDEPAGQVRTESSGVFPRLEERIAAARRPAMPSQRPWPLSSTSRVESSLTSTSARRARRKRWCAASGCRAGRAYFSVSAGGMSRPVRRVARTPPPLPHPRLPRQNLLQPARADSRAAPPPTPRATARWRRGCGRLRRHSREPSSPSRNVRPSQPRLQPSRTCSASSRCGWTGSVSHDSRPMPPTPNGTRGLAERRGELVDHRRCRAARG